MNKEIPGAPDLKPKRQKRAQVADVVEYVSSHDTKDRDVLPNAIRGFDVWMEKAASIAFLSDVNFSHDLSYYEGSISILTEGGKVRKLSEIAKNYATYKDRLNTNFVQKIEGIVAYIENGNRLPKLLLTAARNPFNKELFILDGNHRALAMVIAHQRNSTLFQGEPIPMYVGRKKITFSDISIRVKKLFTT